MAKRNSIASLWYSGNTGNLLLRREAGEDVCGPESECVQGVLYFYEGEDRGYDLYMAAQEFPGIIAYIQLQIGAANS